MIHHFTRATRHLFFWGLIVIALGMTGVRLALSSIEGYKARLASRVGVMVGAPVRIGHMGARMRGFSPEIVLSEIGIASIASGKRNAIELKEIRLGIHLLETVFRRDLLASSWVTLVGVKLTVKRNADGKLSIAGLRASEDNPLWLLETGKYEVLDSDITWQDDQKQGRPLTFESVDMALINEGDRHRLNVLMQLPEKFGETLRVSMDFNGNLFDFKSLEGRAFLEGRNLNLPEWVTLDLPMAIKVASGRGDLRVWSDWRLRQAVAVNAQVDIRGLRLNRPGTAPFAAEQFQSRFYLGLSERQWQLNLKEFALRTRERDELKNWPGAVLSIKGTGGPEKAARRIALYAERLDLQEAALLGRFLFQDDESAKFLRDFDLKGELHDFALFADTDRQILSVNGDFSHAGFAAAGKLPGFENLSGRIRGNLQEGAIELASAGAVFHAPGLFREPLPLDRVEGSAHWQHTEEGLSLASPLLTLDSRGIKMLSRLRFSVPNQGGEPFIDLQSRFSCPDVKVVSRYLPAGIMAPAVVDWLDHAFVKGTVPKGEFLLYGNPGDFPFTGSEGVFEVLFDAENMELAYQPGWPNLTGAAAEVAFYQDSLNAAVRRGTFYDVAVKQGSVGIRKLDAAEKLTIKGELEGGIGRALEFVQNSPLAERVNALLRVATPHGNTRLDLDLEIPLAGGGYRTDVTAQFENAGLSLKSPELTLKNLTGKLTFDDKGVYGDNLTANFLERPVKINLDTADLQTEIRADGRIGIEALRTRLDLPWLGFAEGETAYRLALRLPHREGRPALTIQSDLNGVRLDLPDTLAKPANQKKPITLAFELDDRNTLPVRLRYGDDFSAALKIGLNKPHLESGHVLLGDGRAEQRNEPGLLFEIHRGRLQLHDWIRLAGAQSQSSAQERKIDVAQIKVHGDQGLWQETDLGRFDLDLRHVGAYWEGRVDNAILKGQVKLPADLEGAERIELNLDRLDMSALTQIRLEERPDEARDYFPLLAVRSTKTFWKGADLGRFVMNAERIEGGLTFDRFELQGKDQNLTLTGDWKSAGGRMQTRIKGRLELLKGGALFARLGINKDLAETSGVIGFDLNWQAPPYGFTLDALKGSADVALRSGRILSIEPGFGRVLGILAMAQWFKRLQLDFSDVYQEGLTFNSIKGRFSLGRGKALTDDLVVDAVPAKISIIGETDFVNRTVDHVVTVAPKSADAVPIAGTIMGKFAALIDKTITGTEHEGFFFGSQYLVKGGWGNASILTLHEKEGLLQKTWSGITDFPSLLKNDNNNERGMHE